MRFIVKTSATALTAIAAISAIAIHAQDSEEKADKKAKNDEQIKLVGEPINCVRPRNIRNTNVIDNQTIEFRMIGGKILRNDLGRKCPGLLKGDPISYTLRGTRLCNVDQFTVLRTTAGRIETRARCGFGKFQEIEKIKAKK